MLTTEHPIPLADVITILLFSVIWKALSAFFVGLFRTRSSIVSGTESLISLHKIKPSNDCQLLDPNRVYPQVIRSYPCIRQIAAWSPWG